MKIDTNLISKLERLAAIRLGDESRKKMSGQLETVVSYFRSIEQVDTAGLRVPGRAVEGPAANEAAAPPRQDRIVTGLAQDQVTNAAPEAKNGFIKVPRIIDRE
jgi:aspartyl/glutamyl-tRNA(Asn/Gln) amidotransferase C subunit